jgi:hypothetical protein
MSEDTPIFLVRFSNNRRKAVESQNKKIINRKNNFLEFYTFNFLPIAITSTILAPLNRLKILMQVQDFLPIKDLEGKKINLNFLIKSKINKIKQK